MMVYSINQEVRKVPKNPAEIDVQNDVYIVISTKEENNGFLLPVNFDYLVTKTWDYETKQEIKNATPEPVFEEDLQPA